MLSCLLVLFVYYNYLTIDRWWIRSIDNLLFAILPLGKSWIFSAIGILNWWKSENGYCYQFISVISDSPPVIKFWLGNYSAKIVYRFEKKFQTFRLVRLPCNVSKWKVLINKVLMHVSSWWLVYNLPQFFVLILNYEVLRSNLTQFFGGLSLYLLAYWLPQASSIYLINSFFSWSKVKTHIFDFCMTSGQMWRVFIWECSVHVSNKSRCVVLRGDNP